MRRKQKNDKMPSESDDVNFRRLKAQKQFNSLYIVLQVVGGLMIVITLSWIFGYCGGFGWADPSVRFNFHPICMLLGMVYMGGNSILAFRVLRHQPKPMVKLIHGGLHVSAFVISLFGSIAVFSFHLDKNIPNLYSLHSWLGALTMTLFFLQYFGAFYSFLYPGASGPFRAWLLPYHVLGGFVIFLLAIGRNFFFLHSFSRNPEVDCLVL
jgi:cytochrome b-561